MLDLENATMIAADPKKLITRRLGTAPSGEPLDGSVTPPCPRWLEFIDFATGSDRDLAHYLQQIAGLCLTGDTREQKL